MLGPLLFIVYVNDLSTASHNLFSILFADDTSVFMKGESINEVIHMLNIELHKITVWLESNKLTLNVVKSHFMIFHRAKLKLTKPDVKLCSTTLEQVKYTQFLGMIIDEKLNCIHHIFYIKNKISKGTGIIMNQCGHKVFK